MAPAPARELACRANQQPMTCASDKKPWRGSMAASSGRAAEATAGQMTYQGLCRWRGSDSSTRVARAVGPIALWGRSLGVLRSGGGAAGRHLSSH